MGFDYASSGCGPEVLRQVGSSSFTVVIKWLVPEDPRTHEGWYRKRRSEKYDGYWTSMSCWILEKVLNIVFLWKARETGDKTMYQHLYVWLREMRQLCYVLKMVKTSVFVFLTANCPWTISLQNTSWRVQTVNHLRLISSIHQGAFSFTVGLHSNEAPRDLESLVHGWAAPVWAIHVSCASTSKDALFWYEGRGQPWWFMATVCQPVEGNAQDLNQNQWTTLCQISGVRI